MQLNDYFSLADEGEDIKHGKCVFGVNISLSQSLQE